MREFLFRHVIKVNQDPFGIQGQRLRFDDSIEVTEL